MNGISERRILLNLARQVCEKNLLAAVKRVEKLSNNLYGLDDSNSTVRQRAMLRIKLDTACEERDQWQERIDEIDAWMNELSR